MVRPFARRCSSLQRRMAGRLCTMQVGLVIVLTGLTGCGKQAKPTAAAPPLPTPAAEAAPGGDVAAVSAVKLRPVVYLEAADPDGSDWKGGGILQRELYRQALLMAARESLGLTTRDGSLREALPNGIPADNVLRLRASVGSGGEDRFTVERGRGDGRKVV